MAKATNGSILRDVTASGQNVKGCADDLGPGCRRWEGETQTLGLALTSSELQAALLQDSLSMAVACRDGDVTCSPPTLVITAYAPCSDISGASSVIWQRQP
jgi:hypothetical protein